MKDTIHYTRCVSVLLFPIYSKDFQSVTAFTFSYPA